MAIGQVRILCRVDPNVQILRDVLEIVRHTKEREQSTQQPAGIRSDLLETTNEKIARLQRLRPVSENVRIGSASHLVRVAEELSNSSSDTSLMRRFLAISRSFFAWDHARATGSRIMTMAFTSGFKVTTPGQ